MRKYILIFALVLTASLLSACGGSSSTTSTSGAASQNLSTSSGVSLSWTAPSARTDGTFLPLTELAGYRIYMGTSSDNLNPVVDLSDDTVTSYTVDNLSAGSYYFAVSAYDTDGAESGYSEIIQITLS
ncbi:MAG: fibronectin type III domain-containing protein [Candidatus Thiodiazotropha sp.]|jgi:hypothetical protein